MTNPKPHPLAIPGNRSGAFSLSSGDCFIYDIDGRHGWADEFLQDGDAFVTFDDGTHDTIKWNLMSPGGTSAMNAKQLALALAGMEYGTPIPRPILAEAKSAGLVIVYGSSDDLMEIDGAVYDEVGAWEGAIVVFDADGLQPDFDSIDKEGRNAKKELRDYFRREGLGMPVTALWGAEPGYSWTYKTEIPHETFEIVENGEPYCRGIVFALADVP